jgi:hypothetical protein
MANESPIWDKNIKRVVDILRLETLFYEVKIDYPNRFLSAAQVRPVSSGRTIASVRNKNAETTVSISLRSENGFYTIWATLCQWAGK